jgi:hypothetical protein
MKVRNEMLFFMSAHRREMVTEKSAGVAAG